MSAAHDQLQTPPATPHARRDPEIVPDAALCPICHEVLVFPRVAACRHTFCSPCLATWHFGQPAPPLGPADAFSKPCPLCRALVAWGDAREDRAQHAALLERYPRAVTTRLQHDPDVLLWQHARVRTARLVVGNDHEYCFESMASGRTSVHLWTFYLRAAEDPRDLELVDRIVVRLHPTFTPARIELTAPPFQVKRLGWGIFTIHCEIYWRDPSLMRSNPTTLHWTLDFHGAGSNDVLTFSILNKDSGILLQEGGSEHSPPSEEPEMHPITSTLALPAPDDGENTDDEQVAPLARAHFDWFLLDGTQPDERPARSRTRTVESIFSDPLSENERSELAQRLDEELALTAESVQLDDDDFADDLSPADAASPSQARWDLDPNEGAEE